MTLNEMIFKRKSCRSFTGNTTGEKLWLGLVQRGEFTVSDVC